MKCVVPEISWHNRDPVYTVDIQPKINPNERFYRLASGGADSHVVVRLCLIFFLILIFFYKNNVINFWFYSKDLVCNSEE